MSIGSFLAKIFGSKAGQSIKAFALSSSLSPFPAPSAEL